MEGPPEVLLKFLGVAAAVEGAVSTDLAVLGGTIAVLLGEESSVAGELAACAAGIRSPREGKVLVGRRMLEASTKEGRRASGFVAHTLEAPPGMTPRGCVNLAVTAVVKNRNSATEKTREILEWLDLQTVANVPLEELNSPEIQRTSMAVCMATSPELLVVDSPIHESLHSRLKTFARAGNAVLIRTSSLGEIPEGVERIALCDSSGIVRVVSRSELRGRAMGGAEISVSFCPSLPRQQLETIPGIKNLLHRNGLYKFTHGETAFAVTQLMNLARANSRAVIELHISSMPPSALIRLFEGDRGRTSHEGLFTGEDGP